MSTSAADVRILVASDNVDDAQQILRQLKDHFANVRASTRADRAVQDFEEHRPHVLVLAFDAVDKAERYYLGLYRFGSSLPRDSHRTVILCSKDEVPAVFDLCKRSYFDDYVLYWPHSQDGLRLVMSIWIACREMASVRVDLPKPAELMAHSRHLADLERTLLRQSADVQARVDAHGVLLERTEHHVAGTIDDFSSRLVDGASAAWVEVKDTVALAREMDGLKDRQMAQVRDASAAAIEPLAAWSRDLKQISNHLHTTRPFIEQVDKVRPIVMVVEDDEFARQLVKRALDPQAWELSFVGDAPAALALLRRIRPDVILMDIRLPGVDGVSLTQKLKSSRDSAAIPIIMMTGDARRETLIGAMEAGASAFVVKPFTRESLTEKLDKVFPR